MVKTGKNGENIKGNPPNPDAPQPPAPRCCPVGKPRPKRRQTAGPNRGGGRGLGRTQQQQQQQQPPPPPPLPESSSSTCSSRSTPPRSVSSRRAATHRTPLRSAGCPARPSGPTRVGSPVGGAAPPLRLRCSGLLRSGLPVQLSRCSANYRLDFSAPFASSPACQGCTTRLPPSCPFWASCPSLSPCLPSHGVAEAGPWPQQCRPRSWPQPRGMPRKCLARHLGS